MGISITTVQRMLGASLIAALGVWYLQGTLMDGMLTMIALSALTGLVWLLSDRETAFGYLNLRGNGPWNILAVVLSIVVFAEVSICPETMKLHQRSPRETHFQATAILFEFSPGFSQKSGPGIWWQRAETSRFY